MTWAERVGDLATNLVLVLINFFRIFTLITRIAAEKIDGFVTSLAGRSEGGIRSTGTGGGTWIALPASVAWGIAAVVLRALSVITVFIRQITATADEFLEALTTEAVVGDVAFWAGAFSSYRFVAEAQPSPLSASEPSSRSCSVRGSSSPRSLLVGIGSTE